MSLIKTLGRNHFIINSMKRSISYLQKNLYDDLNNRDKLNVERRSFSNVHTNTPSCLFDVLKQRIKLTGPITVSSYIKEALTNPMWGYYMKKDVFGAQGDFITSPEISQMFGELIGIWFLIQWSQMGKPVPVQLVELGPGRGTIMADILRVIRQFKNTSGKFNVHLVEVSNKMIELQQKNLEITHSTQDYSLTNYGVKVHWYPHIQDVPQGVSFYIAHEFFDALPVHLFRKVNGNWRELLVNLSKAEDKLEFVVAPGPSPLTKAFIDSSSTAEECEICPDAAIVMSHISHNIASNGGCGLIIDYGDIESQRHSLRGFKNHQFVENVLDEPGTADITANVDFSFLKKHVHRAVTCHGPITQQSFLHQMGIKERLQALLVKATKKQSENLTSSYDYLTSTMGDKFKVMALTREEDKKPPAFTE